MKELTIEEKAQKYDKAFRIAQELYNNPYSSNVGKGYVCTVFPELKESDDERIRKELIDYHRSMAAGSDDYVHETWIAWLEKQGEKKPQGKSALEAVNEEKVDNQNCVKPADKIQPKFKVGDRIKFKGIHNEDVTRVITDIKEGEGVGFRYFFADGSIYSIGDDGIELVEEPVSDDLKKVYEKYVNHQIERIYPDLSPNLPRQSRMTLKVFDGTDIELAFEAGAK